MKHPQIMESVLLHQGKNDPDQPYFADGVASAMIMRYDTSPDDPHIRAFIEHMPESSNPQLVELWERDIRQNCRDALDIAYPVLAQANLLDVVFRYKSLLELVGGLVADNGPASGVSLKPREERANLAGVAR